ncbi:MAG: methyltransferase domain-containing protein [Anaerolineae bacterium]
MKRVVVVDDLCEAEIRPLEDFDTYVQLLTAENQDLLASSDTLKALGHCPACGQRNLVPAFQRLGFQYVRCIGCRSLYVSPRPTAAALDAFYATSQAIAYWHQHVLAETAPSRMAHVLAPRLDWIVGSVTQNGLAKGVFVDWHSKYPEFLSLVTRLNQFPTRLSVHPLGVIESACRASGFDVVPRVTPGVADVVVAMEVIERASDLSELMGDLSQALQLGGLLFITTMAASGFDIQILQARAPNLLPPTHLNLLSVEGISTWLQASGFQVLELSTPGQLDVEMVVREAQKDPALILPDWVDDLVRRRESNLHRAFQDFLQQARLSSHLRLVARKDTG